MRRFLKFLPFLVVLFISTISIADVNWVPKYFFDNAGGLNNAFAPTAIADNEASDLQNVIFDTSGHFKTRSGYAKLNSSSVGASTASVGLFYYKPTSGSKFIVSVFDDSTIRKMDYSVGGGPDGTWDNITGSLVFVNGTDVEASFAVGEDILIIEDGIGTTAPYKWTGSGNAAALGGSPPNCKIVAYHKRHAFCAGNSANPSLLYFSDLGDVENWTTGLSGNIAIETNDGSEIRSIVPGYDSLYIWKDRSIWRVTGDDKDSFELQRMVSNIGTLSPTAVTRIQSDFIFLSDQGKVYLYDGGVKVVLLSKKVEGTLDASSFARFSDARAVLLDNDYHLSISSVGASTHDTILVYDSFHRSWTKFSGINANAITIIDDGSGKDEIAFGDYTGFVYKYPSGTNDAGTAINAYYTSKQFRWSDLSLNKHIPKVYIFANQKGNYNLTFEIRADFESTGQTTDVNLLGSTSLFGSAVYGTDKYGGQNLVIGEIEPYKEGKFFQFKFSNSNLDEPIEVKGYEIYIEQVDNI